MNLQKVISLFIILMGTSGYFFGKVAFIPSDSTPIAYMKLEAIDLPSKLSTISVIKTISPEMYNFGKWLDSNKKGLIITDVTTYLSNTSPTVLTEEDKISIWDNLFYQGLIFESGYLREDLILMLSANHFIETKDNIEQTDSAYEKLAGSDIVFPKEIFSKASNLPTNSQWNTNNVISPNRRVFNRHMIAFAASVKSQRLQKVKHEIIELEKTYFKNEAISLRAADNTYQDTLDTSLKGASSQDYTDPNTQEIIPILGEFEIPELDYSPTAQISNSELQADLSADSYNSLNNEDIISEDSYKKIISNINKIESEEISKAFDNSDFSRSMIEVDGIIVSTNKSDFYSHGHELAYHIIFKERYIDVYDILLVLNPGSFGRDVNTISYTIGSPVSESFTDFESHNSGDVLYINLTPESGLSITGDPTSIQVFGTLDFVSGSQLSWDESVNIAKGHYGIMGVAINNNADKTYVPEGFGIARLGYQEYKKVEQSLCCYTPGEVSHIENILAREYKERSTRRLRSVDETTSSSSETEQENLTDSISTSRFDMQQAVSEVLSENKSFSLSAGVHASVHGGTKAIGFSAGVDLGANYAQGKSKETAKNQSLNFAKDITEQALQSIITRVKKERVKRVIEEFEEQNKHGVDNRQGTDHISGVYRWVDLIYKNQIKNYGMRLSYEFMIPDPSYLHYKTLGNIEDKSTGVTLSKPLNPKTDSFGSLGNLNSAKNITENNYAKWAALYNADVVPPPPETKVIGKSYGKSYTTDGVNYSKNKVVNDNIILPEGYGLDKAYISLYFSYRYNYSHVAISIADASRWLWNRRPLKNFLFLKDDQSINLNEYSESVPISIFFSYVKGGIVTINLELKRKNEHYEKWQLETFSAIISGYEGMLKEYNNSLGEVEAKGKQLLEINPAHYRNLEITILKKNCISYLIGHDNLGQGFVSGTDLTNTKIKATQEMDQYAAKVKFFEQAFEWDIMGYSLYPFYWAGKNRWSDLYAYDNADAQFREFMRSGMARVGITVRPGFEDAVLFYMETGQIWNGGKVPIIGDDMHLSIIDEMKEPEYDIEETWTTRIPSSLTLLQSDTVALAASGLPCWCDTGNAPDESIDQSTALDSLSVFIEGQV